MLFCLTLALIRGSGIRPPVSRNSRKVIIYWRLLWFIRLADGEALDLMAFILILSTSFDKWYRRTEMSSRLEFNEATNGWTYRCVALRIWMLLYSCHALAREDDTDNYCFYGMFCLYYNLYEGGNFCLLNWWHLGLDLVNVSYCTSYCMKLRAEICLLSSGLCKWWSWTRSLATRQFQSRFFARIWIGYSLTAISGGNFWKVCRAESSIFRSVPFCWLIATRSLSSS